MDIDMFNKIAEAGNDLSKEFGMLGTTRSKSYFSYLLKRYGLENDIFNWVWQDEFNSQKRENIVAAIMNSETREYIFDKLFESPETKKEDTSQVEQDNNKNKYIFKSIDPDEEGQYMYLSENIYGMIVPIYVNNNNDFSDIAKSVSWLTDEEVKNSFVDETKFEHFNIQGLDHEYQFKNEYREENTPNSENIDYGAINDRVSDLLNALFL